MLGDVLVFFGGLMLVGSAAKFAHVPKVVTELGAMGFGGDRLMQSARIKREQYFGQWLPEPVLTGQAGDTYSNSQMDESLSMAFLMLLERLTPVERAVFLLREMFDYEYAEIGRMLEQNESNCRQLLRRARQHLKQGRPRFDASPRQREELLQRFLHASSRGDMDGLLALISEDIVLFADGGGKATAVPNPIYGADNVARFLVGARRKLLPRALVGQVAQINGEPGVVTYLQTAVQRSHNGSCGRTYPQYLHRE